MSNVTDAEILTTVLWFGVGCVGGYIFTGLLLWPWIKGWFK